MPHFWIWIQSNEWLDNGEGSFKAVKTFSFDSKEQAKEKFEAFINSEAVIRPGGSPAFFTYRVVGSLDKELQLQCKVMYGSWKNVDKNQHKIYNQVLNYKNAYWTQDLVFQKTITLIQSIEELIGCCQTWMKA